MKTTHPLLRRYLSDLVVFVLVANTAVIIEMAREGYWRKWSPFVAVWHNVNGLTLGIHLAVVAFCFGIAMILLNLRPIRWYLRSLALVISTALPLAVLTLAISPCLYVSVSSGIPGAACYCRALVECQEIYRRTHPEYADSMDKLAELAGPELAAAQHPNGKPKANSLCKLLLAQGPHAPGGRRSYRDANGKLTGGYAWIVRPAQYETGYWTFMMSSSGLLCGRDLGPETAKIVDEMTEFDPTPEWDRAE